MLKVYVRLTTRVNQVIWAQSAIKVFHNLSFYNYLLPTNLFCIIIEAISKYIVEKRYKFQKSVLFLKLLAKPCIISGSSGVCAL
jgi:hypothetical protein